MLMIIVSLILLDRVFAQFPGEGHCPSMPTQPDFDLDKYTGMWYQVARSAISDKYIYEKCVVLRYSDDDDNDGRVQIVLSAVSLATGEKAEIPAKSSVLKKRCGENVEGCAKYRLVSDGISGIYLILDTDYTSYSVVWTCKNFLRTHASIVFVYARDKNPDQSVWDKISGVLQNNHLQNNTIFKIDQDCS